MPHELLNSLELPSNPVGDTRASAEGLGYESRLPTTNNQTLSSFSALIILLARSPIQPLCKVGSGLRLISRAWARVAG